MAVQMLKCYQGVLCILRSPGVCAPHLRTSKRHATTTYYVLLPETPPDSADDNAVMQYQQTPRFSVITPVRCITGCAKLAIQYETRLHQHIESLKSSTEEKTFERVFNPIEEISVPLNTAWRTSKSLNFVAGADYTKAFIRIHPQVEKARNERWNNETLYQVCKELDTKCSNLDQFQRRLVSLQSLKCRLNGVELQGAEKKRFEDTLKVLALERANFRHRVVMCQTLFTHKIDDFSVLSEMPQNLLSRLAEDHLNPSRGPWHVTLQPQVYFPFMEYCSDRMLRWNAWNAYNNRASVNFNDRNLANHKLIEEMRQHRRDIAEMLGYENFAEMSMETKMAGSVEKVMDMIESLKAVFWPLAYEEVVQLQKFAYSEGFKERLQVWDVAYWRRRKREHLYHVDQQEIAQYFPLATVLQSLFSLCNSLFGITIQEHTGKVETWHEDVRYFELYDEHSQHMGSFFFDPFSRPEDKLSGSWMDMGRERSSLMNCVPYSYLILNLDKPTTSSAPVLMQFRDVLSLFHEFGYGLQQLMTKVPYSDLAGQNSIEWDAAQVCANFMQRWALEPSFLHSMSSHHQTGDKLPDQLVHLLLQSHRHFSAYDTMRQLYLSAFDMEIYHSETHWHDVMTEVWAEYMPLPLSEDDNHPCSFTHIFSDQYLAAYYSYKWSEMVAADVFAAFREGGMNNPRKVQSIGARFRDSFLSLGGGVPACEVFRRFRGRDPSLDALLEDFDVKERCEQAK